MDGIRDALLRLVKTALYVEKLSEAYVKIENVDNPMTEIYGQIASAIYDIVGEETEEYTDSVTYMALTTPIITEERRTELLMTAYRRNHPSQPSPNLMSSDGMKELYERNGGYMTPEGEWM